MRANSTWHCALFLPLVCPQREASCLMIILQTLHTDLCLSLFDRIRRRQMGQRRVVFCFVFVRVWKIWYRKEKCEWWKSIFSATHASISDFVLARSMLQNAVKLNFRTRAERVQHFRVLIEFAVERASNNRAMLAQVVERTSLHDYKLILLCQ